MRCACIVFLLPVLVAGPTSLRLKAQEGSKPVYEFVKENGKPKYLHAYRYMEVYLRDSISTDGSFRRTHWFCGDLLRTTADSLVLDETEEHWTEARESLSDIPVNWKRSDLSLSDTVAITKAIPLTSVDHIRYQHTINGTGTFITVVSAIGLLIYAPLKAMSFSTGTFDGDKYIRVATPCAIGVGAGLVVIPFTDGFRRLHVKLGQSP